MAEHAGWTDARDAGRPPLPKGLRALRAQLIMLSNADLKRVAVAA